MTFEGIRTHGTWLETNRLDLRPMADADLEALVRWNQDPEVLFYAEGDDVEFRTPEEVAGIYAAVSKSAFTFIIECEGAPIGECWLQRMNLARLRERYPQLDCRRIDLVIGEKDQWGKGYGTEVICALVDFGFGPEQADLIFGCDIADFNVRSRRAFERAGFVEHSTNRCDWRAGHSFDMVLSKPDWLGSRAVRDSAKP